MNHADRVIAEARQDVKDYRTFVVQNPEAPAFQKLLEEAHVTARQYPGLHGRKLIAPEVVNIVSAYVRLRAAAETAKHTLEVYGAEAR